MNNEFLRKLIIFYILFSFFIESLKTTIIINLTHYT